jgi:hypothetical protein
VATAEYITLRGALPERHPEKGPFQSLRAGIVLSIGDTIGKSLKRDFTLDEQTYKTDQDWSRHILLMLTLTGETHGGVTWDGSLEFDWNFTKREWLPAPTLRLKTDHSLPISSDSALALGNPEVAIGVNDGLLKSIRHLDLDSLHADVTLRGSLLFHDQPIAIAAVTIGRRAANAESMERTQARIKAAELLDSTALAEADKALARGDTAASVAWHQKHGEHLTDIRNWQKQLANDSVAIARARGKSDDPPKAALSDKRMYWKASLNLGNMGLGNLIDLVRTAIRSRKDP